MKKKLLIFCAAGILAACTKDVQPNAQCGRITHKFFKNPPMDTSTSLRTYWLQFEHDTVYPNPNVPQVHICMQQVSKLVYDTMLVPGQPYPPIYCR